jgi:hypothetical protein
MIDCNLSDYDGLHLEPARGDDGNDNLRTRFLINTSATNNTIPRIIQMKNIRLNAATLGYGSLSSITTCVKNTCIMTPDIIGPIAAPIIRSVFITAAEVPITSFGINKITIASSVTISPEPIPKKIRLIPTCSGVEWSTVKSMKDSKMVAALGISNLVDPYLAAIIPAIGPRITIANEKGSCRIPTPNALRPYIDIPNMDKLAV